MNIQRISKIIAIAAFVLAGLILCGQDTMSYGYYRYMFNPQQYASEPDYSSSIPHYCYAFCKDHATLYTKVHEFVPKDEVLVYGIAMSMYHDVDIEALLYVKHGDTMVFVDAAPWTSQTSQQQHYFKFDSLCLSPFASICDSIHYETPLYEFYFDRPHLMSDTFYVGYHNIPFPGLEWSGGRTYITRSERPCDSPLGNYIVVFRDMHINCTSWQRGQESRFGGVYPIIIPPCDSTFDPCLPVENFSHEVLSPNQVSFSWDTVGDQTDFQISFGPYDMPPDSNLWHTTMSNPEVYSGCWDEKTYYAAYIRAKCHKRCNDIDTTFYGPWSDPIYFHTGSFMPDTGHAAIAATDSAPYDFSISPNPARHSISIALPPLPNGNGRKTILISDGSGKEVYRKQTDDSQAVVDISAFPAGMYLVTIITPLGPSSQKLVIE